MNEICNALACDPSGGYGLEVPEDWQQGRTLYGGLNAALAVAAARWHQPDLGPLRAVQIAFMAPAAGRVRYVPSVLRSGRSVTFIGVDGYAGDVLACRSILTFGRDRETDLHHQRVSAPEVPDPPACPGVPTAVGPVFLKYMELRLAAGSPPLSGGEPEFSMWVRHRDAGGLDPELALISVADVLPPAVMASRREFRPASSITWTIDLGDIPMDVNGWYLMRTTSDQAADGYSAQAMSCFGADRRLAAVSRQTVATF